MTRRTDEMGSQRTLRREGTLESKIIARDIQDCRNLGIPLNGIEFVVVAEGYSEARLFYASRSTFARRLREALNGFLLDIPDAMDFHLFFVFDNGQGQECQKFVDMAPSDITDEHITELWDLVCVVWHHRQED